MNEFSIQDKVAVITGGAGVMGSSIALSFLKAGAKVALLDIRSDLIQKKLDEMRAFGEIQGFECDVLRKESLEKTAGQIINSWGKIDLLLNIAGGNTTRGTLEEDQNFFDMKMEDFSRVTELNLNGTVLPCLVFGKYIADKGKGSILNISSMATFSAITRVPGYSVAKSGINIFTSWLAMEMAVKFSNKIRVNAIAPGFFIGDQNRNVLLNPDGTYTQRSRKILDRTPMARFGEMEELNGIARFLCSDASSFITGTVIPVDGGFSSFSGV